MKLAPFEPQNDLERTIVQAKSGVRGLPDVVAALAAATLYVSTRSEVTADGAGFEPLLVGDEQAPLVAVFTDADRATLHRERAAFLLSMGGEAVFRRLPPGYGVAVNPGYEAQLIVDAAASARLRAGVARSEA